MGGKPTGSTPIENFMTSEADEDTGTVENGCPG